MAMAEGNTSPPRRLRACAPCARVKAKCHFQEKHMESHLCDRCQALKRECLPQTTANLRKPRRIIQSRECSLTRQGSMSRVDMSINDGTSNPQTEYHQQSQKAESQVNPQPPFGLSWSQAAYVLDVFRKEYTPQLPFVVISSDQAAEALSRDKPFLFRAIMLVASPLFQSKAAKNKRNTLAYLGYRSLVEEDKTLDILQGILVIAAWAHKSHIDNGQVVNLTYLALGYAHNLNITQETVGRKSQTEIPDSAETAETAEKNEKHSLEEKRALLGLYCVLSIVSTRQSGQNPLNTPYVGTCLVNIAQSRAEPSDAIAEHMVRLVQMSERLSEGFGEPHNRTLVRPYAFLLEGTGRRFHTDLNRLTASASYPNLTSHGQMFELHRLYLLVRLYEPAIVVACHPDAGVPQFVFLLTCLRNCLDTIRSFLDVFLESPVGAVLHHSIISSDQVKFVVLQAIKLLLIEITDWDAQSARQALNLSVVLGRVVARYEEAEILRRTAVKAFNDAELTEEDADEMSGISKLAKEIKWLKYWFEARTWGLQTEVSTELGSDGFEDGIQPTWSLGLLEEMSLNLGSL